MSDEKKYMEGNYSSNIFTAIGEWWEDVKQANEIANTVTYFEEYMAYLKEKEEEHHYLVDGAILTCTKCKGEPDEFNGQSFCVPEGITERVLKVTQNSTAINGAGQSFATLNDSKKNVNIFSFGNCQNPPDRDKEREALMYASENEELRKLGTCQYLMDLNDKWENIISDVGYEKVTGVDGQLLETVTMEAILFCKHGGLIYPKSSGYIKTDGVMEVDEPEEELGEMKEYIQSILNALGWTTDSEELQEIEDVLNKFNIIDKNSIACFLLICVSESGAEGTYSDVVDRNGDKYVDKYGRAVTEYYPIGYDDEVGYSFEERGVSYIQITGHEAQLSCLKDLKDMGYYEDDMVIDPYAKGYVEELRKEPWAASAWRWAIYTQPKDNTLNNYVQECVKENNGSLTIGIVLTVESFINSKVSTEGNPGSKIDEDAKARSNTINNALHCIAYGEILNIKDNDGEDGWYIEDGSLYVDGWKYSAPNHWDTFESNYEILKEKGIIQ